MGADARTAAFYGDSGAVPDDRRTVPVGTGDDPRRAAAVWAWAGNRDHLLANAFGVEWAGLYFAGGSAAAGSAAGRPGGAVQSGAQQLYRYGEGRKRKLSGNPLGDFHFAADGILYTGAAAAGENGGDDPVRKSNDCRNKENKKNRKCHTGGRPPVWHFLIVWVTKLVHKT